MARKFSTILHMTAIIAGFGLFATAVQAGPYTPKISAPNISPMRPDFSMRSRDMWQVIDQVSINYLGGAPNTHRYRTQSQKTKR
jgi:hypothetical protein